MSGSMHCRCRSRPPGHGAPAAHRSEHNPLTMSQRTFEPSVGNASSPGLGHTVKIADETKERLRGSRSTPRRLAASVAVRRLSLTIVGGKSLQLDGPPCASRISAPCAVRRPRGFGIQERVTTRSPNSSPTKVAGNFSNPTPRPQKCPATSPSGSFAPKSCRQLPHHRIHEHRSNRPVRIRERPR